VIANSGTIGKSENEKLKEQIERFKERFGHLLGGKKRKSTVGRAPARVELIDTELVPQV